MADVEKININSTDYDIADAKALRNKSTATASSFIDTKAGTTTYPTTGENQTNMFVAGYQAQIMTNAAIGYTTAIGAYAKADSSYSTILGASVQTSGTYTIAIGYGSNASSSYATVVGGGARAGGSSVAVGAYAAALGQNGVAIGRTASINSTSTSYAITVGYSSYVQGNYGIAIGASAGVNNSSTDSIAIGNSARVNNYCLRSVAIGKQATAAQSESVQLGQGTNTNYGSLQFRSWQVIDGDGQIPLERIPAGVQFAVDNIPTVPSDFYYSGDDSKQLAVLYKGKTVKDENDDDVLVRDLCYRTQTSYSRPSFRCTWVSSDYVPNANKDLIYIDQEKLFLKLAEISRTNIDDDNYAGSYVGGDNSSQDMCFYYDGSNQTWSIEFGSDSVETGTSTTPDMIDGITDLREYGIYITGELNLPEEDNEEIFDVEYYAPIYCDGFDYGDNEFTIDYMKFMDQMRDGDWGFGYATGTDDTWSYSDGTNDWDMPVLPKTYEFNDEEYEDITIRFEYIFNTEEQKWGWTEYINGDEVWFWEEQDFEDRFGIIVEHEQVVEYIEMVFRPARQVSWQQFDPIDASKYGTKTQINNLQSQINTLSDKAFHLIQNSRDLNNMKTNGAYWIKASGNTNLPATCTNATDMFLFINTLGANTSPTLRQTLIVNTLSKTIGGVDYATETSNIYVRACVGGTWGTWQSILTPKDLAFLSGFDLTKKQMLVHDANGSDAKWAEGGAVGDIDCGTMS